jgi:hypothetical protein
VVQRRGAKAGRREEFEGTIWIAALAPKIDEKRGAIFHLKMKVVGEEGFVDGS